MVLRILIILRSGHFNNPKVPGCHPELLVILTHLFLRHGHQDPYYPEMRTFQGSWGSWLTSWTPGYFNTSLSDMALRILIILRTGYFKDPEVPGWHPELLGLLAYLSDMVLRILIFLRSENVQNPEVPGWHPELPYLITHPSQILSWGSLSSWDEKITTILRFLLDILKSWLIKHTSQICAWGSLLP